MAERFVSATWAGRVLLFAAIFTLGFGLGKQVGRRRAAAPPESAPERGDLVRVYYLHTTFRCPTCNGIETLARRVVDTEFAGEVAAGTVEWRSADYQEHPELAKQFEVAGSVVVVAHVVDGVLAEYRRLDDVWVLYEEPEAFASYVGDAIRGYLREATE